MTRVAKPIVHHLSGIEPGNIEELAMRIYSKNEYFVLEIGVLSVALVADVDLDGYLDWREEHIKDLDLDQDFQEVLDSLNKDHLHS